jgi:glycosyltransferase involved in cell wall biosynthesis
MKILFLTSRIPFPPNRGDKVRTFAFLKILAKFHEIHLLSFTEINDKEEWTQELKKYCSQIYLVKHSRKKALWNLLKSIFSNNPFQINYYQSTEMKQKVINLTTIYQYDCIYTHLIRMAEFSKNLPCYKILDYTDAISLEYKRSLAFRKNIISKLFFHIESNRTLIYERNICSFFHTVWFISKEDIDYLKLHHSKIFKVSNPVKMNLQKTNYQLTNTIVFVGNLSVPHNIVTAEFITYKIMPTVLNTQKNILFEIIGADESPEITKLHGKNHTKVLGFVENLELELLNCDLFIAPMFFSAGVQNKILEAMSVGLPVITTPNVAKPIGAIHMKHIIIADSEDDFLHWINQMISDSSLREKIGKKAREHILLNFSESAVEKDLLDTIEKK